MHVPRGLAILACVVGVLLAGGCSTAPKKSNQIDFQAQADVCKAQFERSVRGLHDQVQQSAGYIIFPNVSQIAIVFAGGTYGRGALYKPDGTQIGWAALNTGFIGLQAGVQGFRMLVVLQDEPTVKKFMKNQLSGSANAVLVASEEGGSVAGQFRNGVVMYQGANRGLMAGVNVGLDYMRYKAMEPEGDGK